MTSWTAGAAFVAAAVMGLSGCGESSGPSSGGSAPVPAEAAKLSVVASTDVYGDIVQQIGGSAVEVTSIITDPEQDPHSYEADAGTQLKLSKADLVVENGGGYDDFVDAMLRGSRSRATVINAVTVSGRQAPAGGELNEHVWYDFPAVTRLAAAIAQALGTADPSAAATFRSNADAFSAEVAGLEKQEAAVRAAHAGQGVAITEPVPVYLLDACGLVNRTPAEFSEAIEEGTDVSASVLADTLKLFGDGGVKLLAYNEQTSGPETEKVLAAARAGGVAVVPVTETLPRGKDYLSWMRGNVQAISAALG